MMQAHTLLLVQQKIFAETRQNVETIVANHSRDLIGKQTGTIDNKSSIDKTSRHSTS
jgi:hypothetical protein